MAWILPMIYRRSFSLLLVLLFGAVLSLAARQEATAPRESVKVLTIGNSFTANACQFLPSFAEAAGKELLLFQANLGGASFERHVGFLEAHEADSSSDAGRPYKNVVDPKTGTQRDFSLREALEAADWDYVTIQQLSSQSFRAETFGPAHRLIEYIRKHAPEAEILIHQTWTYHDDFEGYGRNGFSVEAMHEGLSAAYQQLAEEYGLRIIPAGNAFHAARQTPRWTYRKDADFDFQNPPEGELPDETGSLYVGYMWRSTASGRVFHLDYRHANDAGKYLGASVWYEMLFGEPAPANAPVPAKLTPESAADLRRIAHEVVQAVNDPDVSKSAEAVRR
jgi:hypothetical protein